MAVYTTIDDPEKYFQTVTYTGNGSTQSITLPGDSDMQPDMVWFKRRDDTDQAKIHDSVRGVDKRLIPSATSAEADDDDVVTAFNSDGFSLGDDDSSNASSASHVAWCWKANGSGGAQTDGDIDTVRSTNTTSLFTVATYTASGTTGDTIGHGLGVKPALYIIKSRDEARHWRVYHHKNTSAPETEFLGLNVTNATEDDAGMTNDTAPTTSLITLGSMIELNTSGEDYVMYAWGEVQGFSKFGSYEGNSDADGPFVYTGFRPAMIIVKNIDRSEAWKIWDNKRDTYNVAEHTINLDAATAENATAAQKIDILSNGFKIRGTSTEYNHSTMVYAAWAEAPFVNSNGVPCNAR